MDDNPYIFYKKNNSENLKNNFNEGINCRSR